jgi:aldose 1-epimerase
MEFTLEPADAQWAQETVNKAMDELRQTVPNGRAFAETVSVILEREKNWVKWKNELCAPFDKEAWYSEFEDEKKVGLEEATCAGREKLREEPEEWPWKLGSEPLTEIWEMGFRDLQDLERPFQLSPTSPFRNFRLTLHLLQPW